MLPSTAHYVRATGLRIDFQVQAMSRANKRYPGLDEHKRHPLGIYPWDHRDEDD